jgi:hypothetical protein
LPGGRGGGGGGPCEVGKHTRTGTQLDSQVGYPSPIQDMLPHTS